VIKHDNEIEQFVRRFCYIDIYSAVSGRLRESSDFLRVEWSSSTGFHSASLVIMALEHVTNIKVDEDTLFFDAIVNCEIELFLGAQYSTQTRFINQSLILSCSLLSIN